MVPATKPNITFQGQGFDLTAIMWNDTANSSHGTFYSASVSVFAAGFVAKNISFIVTANSEDHVSVKPHCMHLE